MRAGALGGKLLGAGGGGFILIYARQEKHNYIQKELKEFPCLSVKFEDKGSTIETKSGFS